MTRIQRLFFELVQITLGNRTQLSEKPSYKEWDVLYEMAIGQAMIGVLQHGLERLPDEQKPCLDLLLEWTVTAQMIQAQNKTMDERCLELQGKLEKAGMQASILKGQGIARLYNLNDNGTQRHKDTEISLGSLRGPGDIDAYVDCGRKEAIERAERIGYCVEGWDYKHAHVCVWENTEVELHYRVEVLFNLFKNRKLQKWFKTHTEDIFGNRECTEGGWLVTPTVEFNVFYILLHIYRHFFTEGVGLRQIMDYYFVLKKCHTDSTNLTDEYCTAVSEFGMERFAKGLMWVMLEVMAMPREWMLWDPDEKEGKYILEQVMEGGNFGHYGDQHKKYSGRMGYVKSLCHHSLHLMKHYPNEAIWVPVWIVWHKLWKISNIRHRLMLPFLSVYQN